MCELKQTIESNAKKQKILSIKLLVVKIKVARRMYKIDSNVQLK